MKTSNRNTLKIFLQYFILAGLMVLVTSARNTGSGNPNDPTEKRVKDLLAKMTLEEKVGQMNQLSNPYQQTGTGVMTAREEKFDEMIANGEIGSFLNVLGVNETMRLQKIAVEKSRLGIPLIFGYDVIHGY